MKQLPGNSVRSRAAANNLAPFPLERLRRGGGRGSEGTGREAG
jgi:hypothetical protein